MDSNRYASPRFKLAVVVSNTARAGKYAALRVFWEKISVIAYPRQRSGQDAREDTSVQYASTKVPLRELW